MGKRSVVIRIDNPNDENGQITLMKKKNASQPVIFTKIDALQLDLSISIKAKSIFAELNIKTRRKPQLHVIYFCVYNAHKKLGITIDPIVLASSIGLNANEIKKATYTKIKKYGTHTQEFDAKMLYSNNKYTSPKDFISHYYYNIGLGSDLLPSIIKVYTRVIETDPDFKDNPPQYIAAAIIWYFIHINGITMTIDKFLIDTKLKKTKIIALYKEVQKIDNA